MFCIKCGTKFQDEMNFCTNCGASKEAAPSFVQEQPADSFLMPNASQGFDGEMEPGAAVTLYKTKKKKPILPIAIASVVIAAIAAVVVIWFIPLMGLAPLMPAQRAFNNFSDEVSQRIAASPFQALVIMDEIFQEGQGTFVVEFDYRSGSPWEPNVDGTVTLGSDVENFEHALFVDVGVMGIPIDLTAKLNSERLALHSRIIDRDNFYGITFATFAQDMNQFGRLIGLDMWTINEMIEAVEILDELMDAMADIADGWEQVYVDYIFDFIAELGFTTEDVEITSGGQNVTANRIGLLVTSDDAIRLMNGLIDIFEHDVSMQNYFKANTFADVHAPEFDEVIWELRNAMRELERELNAELSFAMYVGTGDRLLLMDFEMTDMSEQMTVNMSLDLGSSVTDTWVLTAAYTDRWSSDNVTIYWDFVETSQGYENSISFFDGRDYITLASTWNPSNGRFVLSFNDGWFRESFGGHFNIESNGGFSLQLDRINMWGGQSLDLGMTLSPGANIPRIDFINMDRWDMQLLDLIERSILGMLW